VAVQLPGAGQQGLGLGEAGQAGGQQQGLGVGAQVQQAGAMEGFAVEQGEGLAGLHEALAQRRADLAAFAAAQVVPQQVQALGQGQRELAVGFAGAGLAGAAGGGPCGQRQQAPLGGRQLRGVAVQAGEGGQGFELQALAARRLHQGRQRLGLCQRVGAEGRRGGGGRQAGVERGIGALAQQREGRQVLGLLGRAAQGVEAAAGGQHARAGACRHLGGEQAAVDQVMRARLAVGGAEAEAAPLRGLGAAGGGRVADGPLVVAGGQALRQAQPWLGQAAAALQHGAAGLAQAEGVGGAGLPVARLAPGEQRRAAMLAAVRGLVAALLRGQQRQPVAGQHRAASGAGSRGVGVQGIQVDLRRLGLLAARQQQRGGAGEAGGGGGAGRCRQGGLLGATGRGGHS
jgi:hypothetical protein